MTFLSVAQASRRLGIDAKRCVAGWRRPSFPCKAVPTMAAKKG